MDSEKSNKNQKIVASFIAILAVVVIAVGVSLADHKKDTSLDSSSDTATKTSTSSTTSDSKSTGSTTGTSSSSYKDGSYSADGSYMTPGGQESVTVSVTLKDGVVTDTSLEQHANNQDTKQYQSQFASGYKSKVIGKALDSISLSRVSGSSLTSQGFNSALETIKSQAKA